MKEAININGLRIWVDDAGEPGTWEDALPRVKQYRDCAEDWINAVETEQEARKKNHLTAKEESQIGKLMKALHTRDQAIARWREPQEPDDF